MSICLPNPPGYIIIQIELASVLFLILVLYHWVELTLFDNICAILWFYLAISNWYIY